jgi:hypothetical protein
MPLGATPSRWCVCQFHHFRSKPLYFQSLAGFPARPSGTRRSNNMQRSPEGRHNASSLMLSCPTADCNVNGSGRRDVDIPPDPGSRPLRSVAFRQRSARRCARDFGCIRRPTKSRDFRYVPSARAPGKSYRLPFSQEMDGSAGAMLSQLTAFAIALEMVISRSLTPFTRSLQLFITELAKNQGRQRTTDERQW